ncbi:conserved hypothetical protein [Afipia sp. 1NLS2]|nr:conserved hypothetical protein [Afipia sp. 1NLS2]
MYNQPQKKTARTAALRHAVEVLTEKRESSAIVSQGYVRQVRDDLAKRTGHDKYAAGKCDDHAIQAWQNFWLGKVGTRTAGDLVVAYLAGPEPMNDFDELVGLGVHPHSIYAFESENKTFNEALASAKASDYPLIKIIKMPMDRYLQAVPMMFDVIYFDACGPLPSTSQATLRTVANIFRYQRLNPLGVLITNFAKPDIGDVAQLHAYSDIVSAYLYPKGMLESGKPEWNMTDGAVAHGMIPKGQPEDESLFHKVKADFSNFYGQYITRQLFDLASFIVPMARLSASGLWPHFFTKSPVELALHAAEQISFDETLEFGGGDYIVDADMNPLGWTLASLNKHKDEDYLAPDASSFKLIDTWRRELGGFPNIPVDDVIHAYLLLRNDGDGQWLKPAMKELLAGYDYMQNMYMFCDVPTSELALFPVLAQYAMPYHYNVEQTRRYTYVAEGKSTEMFLDVIPFDTCRYLYDWLPSTELVQASFGTEAHQLVYRFALDGLMKHTIRYNNEYVFGGHVMGVNDDGYSERLISVRQKIG